MSLNTLRLNQELLADYDSRAVVVTLGTPWEGKSMNSLEHFIEHIPWTQSEKKIARKAFDRAFERQCASIKAEAERMIASIVAPADIWRVHDYLSKSRRSVDALYDYRYSVLLEVFGLLLRHGWLNEVDLAGLQQDKIDRIKRWANF